MDEPSSIVKFYFNDEASSPTVFGEEVCQQFDEIPIKNSPVIRLHPDEVINGAERISPDNVSDEIVSVEKSLSESDKAKSSNENDSNGANEAANFDVYDADEVIERRRPARQHKRPQKYEGFETQFTSLRAEKLLNFRLHTMIPEFSLVVIINFRSSLKSAKLWNTKIVRVRKIEQ